MINQKFCFIIFIIFDDNLVATLHIGTPEKPVLHELPH
ncbi:hypothetical protein JCM19238_2075 [Vibrio ponticus]|nr:hypothetical protein JCM19238_2075 [Vibrio ponticus]